MHLAKEDASEAADRQTKSLAGLALTLMLVVASLFLVDSLRARSDLQDCLLAGGAFCPIPGAR